MSSNPIDPHRGEVWLLRFDPSVGSEFQKTRPAVVISEDQIGRLNMRIVVPLTEWQPIFTGFPWVVEVKPTTSNGLSKPSGADTSQVKSVSLQRFQKRLGFLPHADLEEIVTGVALCISYECPVCAGSVGNGNGGNE
ncbi:MAG: type II toxin-antitoxin system PemK/MazF family toxin [Bryobacteraceae bacterium]|nr:type II toxin-antitoxin system PemK/MazF family toxin [Bryobacteraceae bacterium]